MTDDPLSRPLSAPAFASTADGARFFAAYDAALARWPVTPEAVDLPSAYGTTRVNVCGPADAPPLVLLPSGGATSTVWFANVGELSRTHRVYAVDTIGFTGRSVHDGRPVRTPADLMDWLDTVFAGLGIARADLCGHSYGAWLSLGYALHAPGRVGRIALLDPTDCFARLGMAYRLRAVPMFIRPTPGWLRWYFAWETGGAALDPAWMRMAELGTRFPSSRIVLPRHPTAGQLRACTAPTLIVLAENSKAHDIRSVAANARRMMPHSTITTLPGATHHTLPMAPAGPLNRELVAFFS
ncbi:alpha/beta fold hydrolase [Planosporangium sp. 12N6]|uniref:alpha/beta fold hydrolase n=1 Tax=Planosporangium spinosum TaxID=3402278 RepID=UPI003CF24106